MRLVEVVMTGILILAAITIVTVVLKILAFIFSPGMPIVVDFSPVVTVAVIVFAATIISFIIMVILGYIPGLIEEGEEE